MTSCGDFLDIYPLTMVYEDNYWNEKNDVGPDSDRLLPIMYAVMMIVRRSSGESRSTTRVKGFILNSARPRQAGAYFEREFFPPMLIPIGRFILSSGLPNLGHPEHREVAEKDPNYLLMTCRRQFRPWPKKFCYFLYLAMKTYPIIRRLLQMTSRNLKTFLATDGDVIVRIYQFNSLMYTKCVEGKVGLTGKDISYGRINAECYLCHVG